jgi:hypothetical protein
MKLAKVVGQPSWKLETAAVRAYVTRTGGNVAPVAFRFRGRTIEPFHVAPWATEKLDGSQPPILRVLRGDFFCMPFGGNATPFRGEQHSPHGEVANANWKLESIDRGDDGRVSLHALLRTRVRRGRVHKTITLVPGHHAIYSRHVVSQMTGPMTVGHHAMLRFPDQPGSGIVSTSPFVYGQVFPEPVERPENRGYSILKPGAELESLERVQMITGEATDVSRYPARRGFEDIVVLVADDHAPLAWTAVTFPQHRYVWFALKDPRVLRSTILWLSNGGRHYPPWNGRHVNVMGLEEVTANFHYGLAESARPNALGRRGVPTVVKLNPRRPLAVNYIMAVAQIPRGFDRVRSIEAERNGVVLISKSAKRARAPLDLSWLSGPAGRASSAAGRTGPADT